MPQTLKYGTNLSPNVKFWPLRILPSEYEIVDKFPWAGSLVWLTPCPGEWDVSNQKFCYLLHYAAFQIVLFLMLIVVVVFLDEVSWTVILAKQRLLNSTKLENIFILFKLDNLPR